MILLCNQFSHLFQLKFIRNKNLIYILIIVGGKLFAGNRGFDPKTIIMEIISMQFTYYFTLSCCLIVVDFIFGKYSHHGQIFCPTSFDLSLPYSFVTVLSNVINIIFVVVAQAFIVEKAKKCLDHVVTIFFIHLICVWIYNGRFPFSFEWWIIHIALITVTTVLSEMVCMRLEQ